MTNRSLISSAVLIWNSEMSLFRRPSICFLSPTAQTAARILNIPVKEVDKDKHRYPAKRINFGIIYGISEIGLYKQFVSEGLSWSKQDCLDMLHSWFGVYKGIKKYIQRTEASIRRTGRVINLKGRYRLIPEIKSAHYWIRDAGLRQGVNAPIQGGAAEIIKEAMVQLVPFLEHYKTSNVIKPLLQIHDELLVEIREDALYLFKQKIIDIMENAVKLCIPTPVDCEVGYNWRDLK